MFDSRPKADRRRSHRFNDINWSRISYLVLAALVFPLVAQAQSAASSSPAPATCPVEFVHFNPSGVSVRVKNVSGKKIVGLVFNAALADATENWKWYHWNFDDARPIREFGWNKLIKEGASKTLS